jgi:hypothetical protein
LGEGAGVPGPLPIALQQSCVDATIMLEFI